MKNKDLTHMTQQLASAGLSNEILRIIRNDGFQKTARLFAKKNETIFKVLKGLGITIALVSGVFGYLIKANSERDHRRAEAIHKIIAEKKQWALRVNKELMGVRRVRFLIKHDCEHNKIPSSYEQKLKRVLARAKLVEAFTGIYETYDDELYDLFVNFTKFDENVADVCAKDAPSDDVWRNFQRQINQKMRLSIRNDRDNLEKLGHGTLENILNSL